LNPSPSKINKSSVLPIESPAKFEVEPLEFKAEVYYHITSKKWPETFCYLQNNAEGNGRGWPEAPGP
jgi:hypothetical protein